MEPLLKFCLNSCPLGHVQVDKVDAGILPHSRIGYALHHRYEVPVTIGQVMVHHHRLAGRRQHPVDKLLGAALVLGVSGNRDDSGQPDDTRRGEDDAQRLPGLDRAVDGRVLYNTKLARASLYTVQCGIVGLEYL